MREPTKPKKKIIIEGSTPFYDFDFACKKVSLQHFLDWCKKSLPPKAKDVTIEIDETWEYDDCIVSLVLNWKQEIPNEDYKKELKKYYKKLAKWEKENK